MLLENGSNSINGNTVLAPQKTALPKEKVKVEKKRKKKSIEQQERVVRALKFAGCLGATLAVSFTILFRYSSIYSNQKEIININNEISKISQENEALKVQLLKFNNISYIEEVATKELKMVRPIAGNAVYCNLKSVELPHEEKTLENSSKVWLKKIKDFLF